MFNKMASTPAALCPFTESVPANRVLLSFSAERRARRIDFVFTLMAQQSTSAGRLALPSLLPAKRRERRDDLWKHTCLELFLGPQGSPEYAEVNLSPSGDWNIYGFTGYRAGMRHLEGVKAPALSFDASPYDETMKWRGVLDASRSHSALASILDAPVLVMGAAAVLEYENGIHEYWALAHAGPKPDFHRHESFCLVLNSSGAPPP